MSDNAQSRQPRHTLTPPLSLDDGAPDFIRGEYVLVRIPVRIAVDENVGDAATAGTALPPTSNGSSPQHFAFIRHMDILPNGEWVLEVYPVLSFTASGGALAGYDLMNDASKATLLPLAPLSVHQPTPEAFGTPLAFGNWETFRDLWLSVVPRMFTIKTSRPFKRMDPPLIMPFSVIRRIDLYRATLRSNTQTTDAQHVQDNSHPGTGGGSGGEQQNSDQGQEGGGEGQADVGDMSVTISPTIIGDGGGGATEQGQFKSVTTIHDILALEGVDEDAEGADATLKDELLMLAHDSPMWMEELEKYTRNEEKEQKQVQAERALRLAYWREAITMQPN